MLAGAMVGVAISLGIPVFEKVQKWETVGDDSPKRSHPKTWPFEWVTLRLAQGNIGGPAEDCTFTYEVFDNNGFRLKPDSVLSPMVARLSKCAYTPARKGIVVWQGNDLKLLHADELPEAHCLYKSLESYYPNGYIRPAIKV